MCLNHLETPLYRSKKTYELSELQVIVGLPFEFKDNKYGSQYFNFSKFVKLNFDLHQTLPLRFIIENLDRN